MSFDAPLSQTIANKAGPQLKEACQGQTPLAYGAIAQTKGFSMQCKEILHCNCHYWENGKNIKVRVG